MVQEIEPTTVLFKKIATDYCNLSVFNKRTIDAIRNIVDLFVIRSGVEALQDITLDSISNFKAETLISAQPITYNGYLKYLRLVGDFAQDHNYWKTNLFRKIPLAPVGKPKPKSLGLMQLNKIDLTLITHSNQFKPSWFWICMINVLFYTGMRRRQIVSLKLGDIDFFEKKIRLAYESSKTKREWEIPMVEELETEISKYLDKFYQTTGRILAKQDFLFQIHRVNNRYKPSEGNCGMKPEQLTGFFKRLSKVTGFKAGAHRYRHTLATQLCNPTDDSQPNIFSAQEILGHTNISTTRGYVENDIKRMKKAIKMLKRMPKKEYATISEG